MKNEIADQDLSHLFGETITDDEKKNIIRLSKDILKMFDSTTMEMLKKVSEILEANPHKNEIATAGAFMYNPLKLGEVVKGVLDYRAKREERKEFEKSHPCKSREVIPQPMFYYQNSKLSNSIAKSEGLEGRGELWLKVSGKREKKGDEAAIFCHMVYEGKELSIKQGKSKFTGYDKLVHDSVCSLYAAGNKIITSAQVFRHMNGLGTNESINKPVLKKVSESIEKSMVTHIKIDYTEQAKLYPALKITECTIDSVLLHAKVVGCKISGRYVEAYEIVAMPDLYNYNNVFRQIIAIDVDLLNVPDLDKGEESSKIKAYLYKRIYLMKGKIGKTGFDTKILYSTLFENLDIVTNVIPAKIRHKKQKTREKIKLILTSWVKKDVIKGFKECKTGNTFSGVIIKLNE